MASRKRVAARFELIYFLICDEARMELGGKMTLLGVYGDTIVIGSESQTLRGLACVFAFRILRGEAPSSVTFHLDGPNGPMVPEMTIALSKAHHRNRNVVIQTAGLDVVSGTYTARLTLATEELVGVFNIKQDSDLIARLSESYRSLSPEGTVP
jgi:hypothetical protein